MRRTHRLVGMIGLPVVLAAVSPSAMGLSLRDDVPLADYEALVNTGPYSASGSFNTNHSGTLLSPNWVLASAHGGGASTFTTSGGTTVNVAQRILFPGDTSSANAYDGNDFALFRLDAPITSVTGAPLHDPSATGVSYTDLLGDIDGLTAVYGGGGETGTGDVGVPTTQTGTRDILAGTNVIDTVGVNFGSGVIANTVLSDFDQPTRRRNTATDLEVGLVNRDSGGGLWVDLSDGQGPVLIGVQSGVTDPDADSVFGEYGHLNISTVLTTEVYDWIQATTNLGVLLGDADGDGDVDAFDITAVEQHFGNTGPAGGLLFGDADFDGDVDAFDVTTIEQNFGSTLASLSLSGDAEASEINGTPVPEPSSMLLLGVGGLLLVRRRMR